MGGPGAAQVPPTTPLFGTIAHTRATQSITAGVTWCAVDLGTSLFQRAGSGAARIAFPEINLSLPRTLPMTASAVPLHFSMAGRAQLQFNTSSSGRIYFDYVTAYPAAIRQPVFSAYSQSYSGGVLSVRFTIHFPACALPIVAAYRN
jgi:hypothetical protein